MGYVAGKVDLISDIEVIQTELCLADLAAVEKTLHRVNKPAVGRQRSAKLVTILEKCQVLNEAKPVRSIDFSKDEGAAAQAVLSDHGQARHVCRQRRRRRLREQPFLGPPDRHRAKRARRADLCKIRPRWLTWKKEDKRCSSPRSARKSRV
jgi:hypothetical protein